MPGPAYDERLVVPAWVWLVGLALAGMLAAAFGGALGAPAGWTALLVAGAVVVAVLARSTGVVRVDDAVVRAGRARLPLTSVARASPLDAEQARRLRGRDADPRAFLYLRGWVPTAVRVDLADRVDPTPYWYVSTRHPDALADAITGRAAQT